MAPTECTQVEIETHRWYVAVVITLPDGSLTERVIACPMQDGMVVYNSRQEYKAASE